MSPAVVTPFVYGTLVVFLFFVLLLISSRTRRRETLFLVVREFFSRKNDRVATVRQKETKKKGRRILRDPDLTYFHLKSLVLYSCSADPRQSTVKVRYWDKTLGERGKKKNQKNKTKGEDGRETCANLFGFFSQDPKPP